MLVPSGHPSGETSGLDAGTALTSVPVAAPFSFVLIVTLATDEMLARASPLKPRVRIFWRSSSVEILLVE